MPNEREQPSPLTNPSQTKMLDVISTLQMLHGCIIAQSYSVPVALTAPLVLTHFGAEVKEELRSKHRRTRPNEATLAVALEIGVGDEMLVDFDRTNVDSLRSAIADEIQRKRIFFVDQYQRTYAEELFRTHEFNPVVAANDGVKFLKDKEQGVFQIGFTTVGPWGCIASRQFRILRPTHTVHGFYCEDPWCTKVHVFMLESSRHAPINKARSDLGQILERYRGSKAQTKIRSYQLEQQKFLLADPLVDSGQLINFIGDSLIDSERRDLAAIALKKLLKSEPSARAWIGGLSESILINPQDFAAILSFGEVMHLFHLLSDDLLVRSLDEAVFSGALSTDPEVLRTARIPRWPGRRLSVEVGTNGLRFVIPDDRENVLLGHLLHRVYKNNPGDLAYALDHPEESLDSLISHAVREMDVGSVADQCLIHDRRTAETACELLRIDDSRKSRSEIAELLKWRLGISNDSVASQSDRILTEIDDYLTAAPGRSEQDKRGELANLYVNLETELMLAIRFAEWTLLRDHYVETPPFSLQMRDLPASSSYVLDRNGNSSDVRPTLQPLAASFANLADHLEAMPEIPRDPSGVPVHAVASGRPFAFAHHSIFHDLEPEARSIIQSALREASRELSNPTVLAVRNAGPGHGNNQFPDDERVRVALSHAGRGLRALASSGLTPIVYERMETTSGRRGRTEIIYGSWIDEISIRVPYWPLAPGLPYSATHLVIVNSAYGPGWGSLRFRMPRDDRGGTKWSNWPPRRRADRPLEWKASQEPPEPGSITESLTA